MMMVMMEMKRRWRTLVNNCDDSVQKAMIYEWKRWLHFVMIKTIVKMMFDVNDDDYKWSNISDDDDDTIIDDDDVKSYKTPVVFYVIVKYNESPVVRAEYYLLPPGVGL